MNTIKNIARNIVAPSVHPVAMPSSRIPINVETNAATIKILNMVSSKHSVISSHKVVSSFSINTFLPYNSLDFAIAASESIPLIRLDESECAKA